MILLWLFVVISSISLSAQINDTFFSRGLSLGANYKTCKKKIVRHFPTATEMEKDEVKYIEVRNCYFGGTTWDVITFYFNKSKFQTLYCVKQNNDMTRHMETELLLKNKYAQYLMLDQFADGRSDLVFDDGNNTCCLIREKGGTILLYDHTSYFKENHISR